MTGTSPPLFEVCIDSVVGAIAAEAGGAGRVELCSALELGGLSPSIGLLAATVAATSLPVMAMVRPRGGNFCYSETEIRIMETDIAACKKTGAAGLVFGALLADGRIDVATTERLVRAARPLPVTFHRAFDYCADPFLALDQLIDIGVERVLTSGQAASAPQGRELLRGLIDRATGRIGILPGGGIRPQHTKALLSYTGAAEFHATAFGERVDALPPNSKEVQLGSTADAAAPRRITTVARVRQYLAAL